MKFVVLLGICILNHFAVSAPKYNSRDSVNIKIANDLYSYDQQESPVEPSLATEPSYMNADLKQERFWDIQNEFSNTDNTNGLSEPYLAIPYILFAFLIVTLHVYYLDKLIRTMLKAFPNSKSHFRIALANLVMSFLITLFIFVQMVICFKAVSIW